VIEPITYAGGGPLGDFIHQLSVVQENFLTTGRKGRVYVSNRHEGFRFGIERAYTDLAPIVSRQDYVESFRLHAGEPFAVNLNDWRYSPLLYGANWHDIFAAVFRVPWGAHPWLTLPASEEYANTTLISLTSLRPPTVDWNFLKHLPNILFVTDSQEELDTWRKVIHGDAIGLTLRSGVPTKVFPSLYELYRAIAGSKLFIGSLSSPLAAALAAYRPCIALLHPIDTAHVVHVADLGKYCPHFHLAPLGQPVEKVLESL